MLLSVACMKVYKAEESSLEKLLKLSRDGRFLVDTSSGIFSENTFQS